ncbi:MAG: thiamine-phosphate kinase [Parvibaculum sp.]|uniref:thiamine-phosphate kinase n=1 Tax=Parvibaculum sp. TaxID=2024848 RepID=UPI0032645C7F
MRFSTGWVAKSGTARERIMVPPDKADGGGKRPGEFELIEKIFAPLAAGADGAYALKDDAALYRSAPGCETVLTVDAMVAGVHFLPEDPPESVARKLLRVNLSDLAAKGAVPKGYLLTTVWAEGTSLEWIEAFASGLESDQVRYGVTLWGGDTVKTPGPLTLSLTAIGEVAEGQMIRRGGARPGDDLYITGTVGDGGLGLMVLQDKLRGLSAADAAFLCRRYREPDPRTDVGPKLCGIAHAALDVSDGLMADLGHICEVSGVGARVEMDRVPLSEAARAALDNDAGLVAQIAGGGDDYEILFVVPAGKADAIAGIAAETGVPVTRIGSILRADQGLSAVDGSGRQIPLKQLGYRHF